MGELSAKDLWDEIDQILHEIDQNRDKRPPKLIADENCAILTIIYHPLKGRGIIKKRVTSVPDQNLYRVGDIIFAHSATIDAMR